MALSRGNLSSKGGATEGDGEMRVPRSSDRYDHRTGNRQASSTTLQPIVSVSGLSKIYASGFQALKNINLDIRRGEIFALLGPNGAGKTTLISITCGIVNPTRGIVSVDGHDIITEYRAARSMIGLEPQILFLDEPTAGVDVELRREMWETVRSLRATGVTIILTTHYIHEAEEMADRIGVISDGEIILVEDKAELMRKLGKKQLTLYLHSRLDGIPGELAGHGLELAADGSELVYTYDTQTERADIAALLADLAATGIEFKDLQTKQSSLEDIFVGLVEER